MMIPLRTQVKFFLENPEGVDLATFSPVFQRWIQQKALKGQLIDVADYRHVFEGPGMVLIGYDSDYFIENRDGRLGLLYTRKRQVDADVQAQLRASLQLALDACQLLEADDAFNPRLKFRADEIELRFPDRLRLPNKPETFDLIKDDVGTVLAELYGSDSVNFAPVSNDPRYLFTIAVQHPGVTSINELFQAAREV
ncbi:MAG TPA: hypothetical protein VK003_10045 [Oceanobacillus sp.]|nr:hypothetical protein [Oceanobacillus sp.]